MTRQMGSARQVGIILVLALLVAPAAPAFAEGFRIENRVFNEKEEEPITQSTTIFCDDMVYDYLKKPEEITVFDREAGRIILLDPIKRVRTELTTQELERLSQRLRAWASSQSDDLLRFSAEPSFDNEYDSSTNTLVLNSPWVSYQVGTQEPPRSEILQRYLEFCDWYCLLNTRLNPGTRPPFPRMLLNDALKDLGKLPSTVRLTVRPQGERFLGEKMSARSEHHVIPHLVESDRSRVAQTDQFMAMFRPVPFREYQAEIQPTVQ